MVRRHETGRGLYGRAGRARRLAGAGCLLAISWACATPTPRALPPAPLPPRAAAAVPPPPCQRIASVEVRKGARKLRATCERGAVVELQVAIGRENEGPKRSSGDARTPEGRYRISGAPRESRFHLFVPIDYPSVADAEIAREQGLVSEADYFRILDAHARGEPPPGDTALGGELGFHGEGERWRGDSRHLDWTYGCVALSDTDIEFLAERTAIGTPVVILP